ncbi:MAG: AzlD domain-containing protein [Synechococcaceae cyanobacterium RM1_1_27]|nr:AzlD domain-containing protein [Synechococcaceae cyanobacterium RM1_1_27]
MSTTGLIVLIALGTYLMRAIPFLWGRNLDPNGRVLTSFQALGPMLIAALLGVSVAGDAAEQAAGWLPVLLGLMGTGVLYRWQGGFCCARSAQAWRLMLWGWG